MSTSHVVVDLLAQAPPPPPAPPPPTPPADIPNPGPLLPPGADKLERLVGNIKWLAGISLVAAFFLGLIVWSAGRGVDHHRAGRIGTVMMLVGVFGGLAYALGWQMITYFAQGG